MHQCKRVYECGVVVTEYVSADILEKHVRECAARHPYAALYVDGELRHSGSRDIENKPTEGRETKGEI